MLVTEHHDVSLHEHADENASSLADVTKDPLVSVALVFSGSWARKLKSPPRCGNNKWSVTQQPQQPRVSKIKTQSHMAVCQNLVPLVNIKIAGKWMFIPTKNGINRY